MYLFVFLNAYLFNFSVFNETPDWSRLCWAFFFSKKKALRDALLRNSKTHWMSHGRKDISCGKYRTHKKPTSSLFASALSLTDDAQFKSPLNSILSRFACLTFPLASCSRVEHKHRWILQSKYFAVCLALEFTWHGIFGNTLLQL